MTLGLIGWGNFFQSYLYAFMFWFGIALGSLGLLLIGHLAGGPWAAMIRRPLEAGAMNIPIMAGLFIIILLGMGNLYEWTHADYVASHPLVAAKTSWLNVGAFILRSVIYFAIWTFLAWRMVSWSKAQDADASKAKSLARSFQRWGAGGFLLTAFLMTFAAFDWAMSLNPEWYSGLYGVIFMIGQAITTMAFLIIFLLLFSKVEPYSQVLNSKRVQDLGNFLMAFTMFWAYVNASQLIIYWSGNTIETNPFYVLRMDANGPWRSLGGFLMIFHFFVPFIILFSRWVKRSHRLLAIMAAWMLIAQLANLFFYIMPEFHRTGFQLHLGDILALVGIGAIWIWGFIYWFTRQPLLPLNDPRLSAHDDHHGHHESHVAHKGAH
ncbi:MAG: hypothetical protein R2865_04655 [Deinococcales bacterium]